MVKELNFTICVCLVSIVFLRRRTVTIQDWVFGLGRGIFRAHSEKMQGKFRTKLKHGIFPAEKYPCGNPPPPVSECVGGTFGGLTLVWGGGGLIN